jgi:hypothetical protein
MKLPENMKAFSLREIAAWQDEKLLPVPPEWRAKVPVLQRGLVWDPSQVELLWDSLLRGFPVGALVLSEKIPGQEKDSDKAIEETIHHLLDGQQRSDAIALAYRDAFAEGSDDGGSILWLDLAPNLSRSGTRQFVLRLTTKAHPWGYRVEEKRQTLSANQMRAALEPLGEDVTASEYVRPVPAKLSPYDAAVPVPVSWLLRSPVTADEESFWKQLADRAGMSHLPWAGTLIEFLGDAEHQESRRIIHTALLRLEAYRLIGVRAPEDIMEVTGSEEAQGISGIEHLFQRLNSQGTVLNGEELAFSMIKAYWPELAGPIDRIEKRPMPASRMVNVALRVALTKADADRIAATRKVSQIRKLAKSRGEGDADLVETYLRDFLSRDMATVDNWLSYDKSSKDHGLLPVLSGNLTHSHPDLFCLLLGWAARVREGQEELSSETIQCLPGLCTLVMWFGSDHGKVVTTLFQGCHEEVTVASIRSALAEAWENRSLQPLQTPADYLSKMVEHHSGGEGWTWEAWFGDLQGEEREGEVLAWERLWQLAWNRDLLLYAQRHYIARRFSSYDPAQKDLWEGLNRPWDFDHICAHKYFHGKWNRETARQWGNTIGNLRAWPFEDNRSDQFELADAKLGEGTLKRDDSFIAPDEVSGFSQGDGIDDGAEGLAEFASVVRSRLVRIYQDWFESAGIAKLLPPKH